MLTLADLSINPIAVNYPQQRLYTFSGRGSVSILPNTTLGVGPFWFPPVSGAEFGCDIKLRLVDFDLTIGDQSAKAHYAPPGIMVQDIQWRPWGIERRGIYHRKVAGRAVCIEVASTLHAPGDADGWILGIDLNLHGAEALEIELRPQITDPKHAFGACHDGAWNYEPPSARGIVWSQGAKVWRTDGYQLHFVSDESQATDAGWRVRLEPGQARRVWLGATLHGQGMKPFARPLEQHAATSRAHWETQWSRFVAAFGARLQQLPEHQQRLAGRAWVTLMVSRWSRENFIADPYYATEGIDGGAICSYIWDISYTSRLIAQLEGADLKPLLRKFVGVKDFWSGYALSPLNTQWLGVFYAFNPYALVKLVSDYVLTTEDTAFLTESLDGGTILSRLEEIVHEFARRYTGEHGLLDFGHNRHLIELHTAGYEGIVPNPTFEHVWTLRTLNRLRLLIGQAFDSVMNTRATSLSHAAHAAFWNDTHGWYFPVNQHDSAGVWSIQVLSALRLGVFTDDQARRLSEHLTDGGFLGSHGVHSIAPHDRLHYTLNDVDWGGGGCFVGHVGIILEGLALYGLHEASDRILERVSWWGTHLPYLPQSARADAPAAFQDRPNAVAAGAVAQALLMPAMRD